MPYRRGRSSYPRRMAPRQRYLWSTINGSLTPSLTTGQFGCIDLLADLEAISNALVQQVGIRRVRITLTPTTTPALADTTQWAVGIARKNDIGSNVVGAITTAQIDYPWMIHNFYTMNGTIGLGGSNTVVLTWKGSRRVTYNQLTLGLYQTSGFAAAVQWRLHSRVLCALP